MYGMINGMLLFSDTVLDMQMMMNWNKSCKKLKHVLKRKMKNRQDQQQRYLSLLFKIKLDKKIEYIKKKITCLDAPFQS